MNKSTRVLCICIFMVAISGTLGFCISSAAHSQEIKAPKGLDPHDGEAIARCRYQARDTCPIQFRKIDSATEMIMLLQRLLGRTEADKVRREVVRRRAGISPNTEDFTTSKSKFNYPLLSTIFKKSFGVTIYPSASNTLTFVTSQYPELDEQIRRYLSGKDLNSDRRH